MSKHAILKGAAVLAVSALGMIPLANGAWASPPQNLSFDASSDGASAGWSHGVGSAIDLTLGSSAGSYAMVTLHHLAATPVAEMTEPTFTTDNYNAGSPRYYITLSGGDTLWGYPPNSGLNGGTDFAWAIDNGNIYPSWTAVQQSSVSSETVTGAYVIADADQSSGTTDVITALTFDGKTYN